MYQSVYVTDFGTVAISDDECRILETAEMASRELAGSPFLKSPVAERLLAKAAAIELACNRTAEYKFKHS